MSNLIIIYITNPSQEKAQEVVRYLLKRRLIACANIIQAGSWYWWQGAITQEGEAIIIAKTVASLYKEIKKEVATIHPYEVPCIIKISIDANQSYSKFITNEVGKK